MQVLGLDIGGSGIKGNVIETSTGSMLQERYRLPTPQPVLPNAVVETVAAVVRHFNWQGPVGCGFPAVIHDGVILTAANIAPEWIGQNGQDLLAQATGCQVLLLNDADAAGLAEMRFGAGKGRQGLVLVITLGTGIGTALFCNGQLVPNTELGHIELRGKEAEKRASDGIRKAKKLSWLKWAERLDEYLLTMERLFWPNLIILGGGVSKSYKNFIPFLTCKTEIVPAQLRNEAGIIGSALAFADQLANVT